MAYYRKTELIEARQFDPVNDIDGAVDVMAWAGMEWTESMERVAQGRYGALIPTLEDGPEGCVPHYVSPGDWIAKGGAGEFWAIKPDRFAASYERVH